MSGVSERDAGAGGSWTFLTNHGHVMVCIAQNPDVRLADIADRVGIGERAAHRIVHELIDAGYLTRTKVGRRNVYSVDLDRPLRHPLESSHRIGAILVPLAMADEPRRARTHLPDHPTDGAPR